MFARRVEGRHSCEFVHALGRWKSYVFFVDFGVIFLPGGTPGASRAPLGAQVGSQVVFLMVLRRPGDGFWAPFGPFGLSWACRGATLGVALALKVGRKE